MNEAEFLRGHDPDELLGKQIDEFEADLKYLRSIAANDGALAALRQLESRLVQYTYNLTRYYNRFRQIDGEIMEQMAVKKAIGEVEVEAPNIVRRRLEAALLVTPEYNHPVFRERLFDALYDTRLITIKPQGQTIAVDVNMRLVAGELSDWENAVKLTREQLNIGRSEEPKRSYMWMEKFYKVAREGKPFGKKRKNKKTGKITEVDLTAEQTEKYWNTIHTRLNNCTSVAPFWYILNYGTSAFSTESDGVAYPVNAPTNFVEKSEFLIKSLYKKVYATTLFNIKKEFDSLRQKYQVRQDQAYRLLQMVQDKIKDYERRKAAAQALRTRGRTTVTSEPSAPDFTNEFNILKKHLTEEEFLRADRSKLLEASQILARGESLPPRFTFGPGFRKRTVILQRKISKGE